MSWRLWRECQLYSLRPQACKARAVRVRTGERLPELMLLMTSPSSTLADTRAAAGAAEVWGLSVRRSHPVMNEPCCSALCVERDTYLMKRGTQELYNSAERSCLVKSLLANGCHCSPYVFTCKYIFFLFPCWRRRIFSSQFPIIYHIAAREFRLS